MTPGAGAAAHGVPAARPTAVSRARPPTNRRNELTHGPVEESLREIILGVVLLLCRGRRLPAFEVSNVRSRLDQNTQSYERAKVEPIPELNLSTNESVVARAGREARFDFGRANMACWRTLANRHPAAAAAGPAPREATGSARRRASAADLTSRLPRLRAARRSGPTTVARSTERVSAPGPRDQGSSAGSCARRRVAMSRAPEVDDVPSRAAANRVDRPVAPTRMTSLP